MLNYASLSKYNDDENDLVTLSGENDFAEAISISVAEKRKALRVRVITEVTPTFGDAQRRHTAHS